MRRTPAAILALLAAAGIAAAGPGVAGAAGAASQGPHDVPARIVVRPQVGIAGVALGDGAAAVRARLGAPVRIARDDQGALVHERWFYRGLRVGLIGGRERLAVFELHTASRRARTARGVGVGSRARAVRADYPAARCTRDRGRGRVACAIGEPGFRQTLFDVRRGRVRAIVVADVV